MFFLRRTRPLELTAGRMRALRLSLNTPVLATQDLPPGPARAAIALHAEPRGGLAVTVGVRALGCGSVALYGFDGPLTAGLVNEAMDAALSFAEEMGFLFDDELVGRDTDSQEKALVRWLETIGEAARDAPASEPELEALELFELAGGDLTDPPVPAPLPPAAGGTPPPPAAPELAGPAGDEPDPRALSFEPCADEPAALVPLTKFRVRADTAPAGKAPEPAAAPRAPSRRPLARVRLTRRAPGPRVQDARRSFLLRLLTSF